MPLMEILVCDGLVCHFILCLPEKWCLSCCKCWEFCESREVTTSVANTVLFELCECSPKKYWNFYFHCQLFDWQTINVDQEYWDSYNEERYKYIGKTRQFVVCLSVYICTHVVMYVCMYVSYLISLYVFLQ